MTLSATWLCEAMIAWACESSRDSACSPFRRATTALASVVVGRTSTEGFSNPSSWRMIAPSSVDCVVVVVVVVVVS